jgi:hypothetical protein
MQIYLIHLINSFNLGGSTTYLVHLYDQFIAQGYEPVVLKRGKKRRTAHYYHVPVHYITDAEILFIAKNHKCIISYCFWSENADLCKRLLALNVPMVVHDPAEFHDEWISIARTMNNTIVIREQNKKNLHELGVASHYIQHPYNRAIKHSKKTKFAICPARIDFRKHTEIVCAYNEVAENKIDLYGEVNRFMEFHKLLKLFPNWKQNYHGTIPAILGEQVKLVSQYQYSIDLTAIKKDGGGTQYCFLEAWDSGAVLILNKLWDTENSTALKEGENCFFVQDAIELQHVLDNRQTYDLAHAHEQLKHHHHSQVIPQYKEVIHI